jgi:hypothetical protein
MQSAAKSLDPDLEDPGYSSAEGADAINDMQGNIALHLPGASIPGMVSLSFMRTDSGPVLLNPAFRSYSGNMNDEFQLGISGDDGLALDAFDSPSLQSDDVPSKSGRNRLRRPLQPVPLRASDFSFDSGLHQEALDHQFMMDDSEFEESSYYSSDESSTSAGAKRKRDGVDTKLYVTNNDEISPLCSGSSSPAGANASAGARVSWVRSRGKSGQFLGWGEVEVRVNMLLDNVSCVTKRIAIITRRSRNEICGVSNSSSDEGEFFSNSNKVATLGRTLKVPPCSPEVLPVSSNVTASFSRHGRGKLSLDNLRSVLRKNTEETAPTGWAAPKDSDFQCAYELCPFPTKSSGSWKTVTKDTSAGQRNWLPYMGLTFCHACWTQFRTRGTLERLGRRSDEPPPPPTNDVIRSAVTVPPKSPRMPASSPRLESSAVKTKSQSPAISARATPSMTPKAGKQQSPALKPIGSPALLPQKSPLPPSSFQEPCKARALLSASTFDDALQAVSAKSPVLSAKSPRSHRGASAAEYSAPATGVSPRPALSSPSSGKAPSPRVGFRADYLPPMEPLALPKGQFCSKNARQ